jgi:hypothetical protein
MADVLKILADSAGVRTPAAATATTVYTVPGSTQTMLTRIIICNTSATPTLFRIALIEAGTALGSLALDHYVAYDIPIGGNETINFALGVGLAATSLVVVYNTLATLTFTPCGIEVT